MGSTGTGRFTDYGGSSAGGAASGSGGGDAPATSGKSQCEKAHGDIPLEEVARCEYFTDKKKVPPVDTEVVVRSELVGGRLAIELVKDHKVIGLLPTRYLYLRKCILKGWIYRGQVLASSAGKVPIIRIDLAPEGAPE